jgi:hypothetical protein
MRRSATVPLRQGKNGAPRRQKWVITKERYLHLCWKFEASGMKAACESAAAREKKRGAEKRPVTAAVYC